MIITCSECSARFIVKPLDLGSQGRKVRCGKCRHTWFQEGPEEEELNHSRTIDSIAMVFDHKEIRLPVVQKKKYFPLGPLFMVVFLALVVGIMTTWVFSPSLIHTSSLWKGYYRLFGIYDTSGVVLEKVETRMDESGNGRDLMVSGVIRNTTREERQVPSLRVSVYNSKGTQIKRTMLGAANITVAAGQSIEFHNKVPYLSNDAEKVVMDLGNAIDLYFR